MKNLSKKGSRLTAFIEEEKDFLIPLPVSQDKEVLITASVRTANKESSMYGLTRGASYYEGGERL